jgi:hypothetical protein
MCGVLSVARTPTMTDIYNKDEGQQKKVWQDPLKMLTISLLMTVVGSFFYVTFAK